MCLAVIKFGLCIYKKQQSLSGGIVYSITFWCQRTFHWLQGLRIKPQSFDKRTTEPWLFCCCWQSTQWPNLRSFSTRYQGSILVAYCNFVFFILFCENLKGNATTIFATQICLINVYQWNLACSAAWCTSQFIQALCLSSSCPTVPMPMSLPGCDSE